MNRFFPTFVLALAAAVPALATAPDYLREVKPLLSSKCFVCHGPAEQKGGLRLDSAAAIRKGGDSGPAIEPGKAGESLMMQTVLGTHADIKRMPLKKPALEAGEIALLRKWIDGGAPAPADERHWAFIAPERPAWPAVENAAWPRNGIDRFILARLEQEKIGPSPEADRVTLLRRVKLDLLGLPPTPEETDAFLADSRPDAYERLVDTLLDSPHYGERWGRLWLDQARYADSNGYSQDFPRTMWPYRDWVIEAMNRDMPFDQFTIEQLAGDLLPNATQAQRIATGFHRNTQINSEGGIDKEQFRIESLFDRVATTGTVWLGLTIGCAQCHDHKFDPLAQKDYYQMMAFFNDCDEPSLALPDAAYEAAHAAWKAKLKAANEKLAAYAHAHTEPLGEKLELEANGDSIGLARPAAEGASTTLTLESATAPVKRTSPLTVESIVAKSSSIRVAKLDAAFAKDPEYKKLKDAVAALQKAEPKPTAAFIMAKAAKPRETHLFIKGDFTRPADLVTPGVPKALPALETPQPTRLDLARWLVSAQNPLTARVTVNRLWQHHFGKGLVETDNDFGTQGLPPSHPELLDWLATELVEQKWSLKAMHRAMVLSATYRQSSKARPELALVDPTNKLLARQNRFRIDAELVRDVGLAASGLLNPKIGGPSVYPPVPESALGLGQVKQTWNFSKGDDRYRRGMYTFFYRASPHPALTAFDAADGVTTCTRRNRSNTPLQALTLLNDAAFYEMAESLAGRLLRESAADDRARIEYGFRLCVARRPSGRELTRLTALLDAERQATREGEEAGQAAWITLARVLLNLDETITRE